MTPRVARSPVLGAGTQGTSSGGPSHPGIDGARGRCTAWSKGGLAATSTAYHRLVVDAGGQEQIGAYCASILGKPAKPTHPKKTPNPSKHPKKSGATSAKKKSHAAGAPGPRGHLNERHL